MLNNRYLRVLVTGFGPFRDILDNPSSKLAEASGAPFKILDVAYAAVDEFLNRLDPSAFDILLMMGVASGRDKICPEMFGRNFTAKHPDVTGEVRFGPIDDSGTLLLPTTLWRAETVADWTVELPVQASYDAGEYLCNYIFYRALERFPDKKVGFLHVPPEEELPLEKQGEVLGKILDRVTTPE